jgi:RNA polymerase sigma-70 factor (ECF subfamily)
VTAPTETALLADDTDIVAPLLGQDGAREIFGLVYTQMRKLVGGRPEFDDLVQTAAEQALRSLGSFEGRSKLSTWTYRICYLTLLKHERWYRRWLRRFALTESGDLTDVPQHRPGIEVELDKAERAMRLRGAIDQLSAKRRAVLILHDLEGHSVEEISGVVGANPLTVRSRLRDGRQALADILTNDDYFGDDACSREEIEE